MKSEENVNGRGVEGDHHFARRVAPTASRWHDFSRVPPELLFCLPGGLPAGVHK